MSLDIRVCAQSGCHKHFLNYFLDRFSSLTPVITELPFTKNGTSHKTSMFSGAFIPYHPNDNPPHFNDVDKPHVIIKIEVDDILFLERIVSTRAADFKQDLNSDYIKLSESYIRNYQYDKLINDLFGIQIDKDTSIPKFVFRDIKKMMFLDVSKNGFLTYQNSQMTQLPKNHYIFPLGAFWDKKRFFIEMKKLDNHMKLSLALDKDAETVHDLFLQNIHEYSTRDRMSDVIKALDNKENYDITNLDLIEQAYLCAYLEKNNDFITMPLTNHFFQNTHDILQYLKYYPLHYKAMNPNLPTFNGIPNPYHLAKLKK